MLIPYEYYFDEQKQAIVFLTDNAIHYELENNQVGDIYFPEYPSLHRCYEVSLNNSDNVKAKPDKRISLTVVHIIEHLLSKGDIIFFICDSSDNREKVRHKIFNQWFRKYSPQQFEKNDIEIEDDKSIYYLSFMFDSQQHDCLFIQNIFQEFINEYIVYKINS